VLVRPSYVLSGAAMSVANNYEVRLERAPRVCVGAFLSARNAGPGGLPRAGRHCQQVRYDWRSVGLSVEAHVWV
jgi:hypothetical protein